MQPEQKLWLSVIDRAIKDFKRKDWHAAEDALNDLKNQIIAGEPEAPYVGERTESKVDLAEAYLQRFPIGSEFHVKDFEDFCTERGIMPEDRIPQYDQLVRTSLRDGVKREINAGAKHEQWPDPSNRFKILIRTIRKQTLELAHLISTANLSVDEKRQLMDAINVVAKPLKVIPGKGSPPELEE